LDTAELFLQDAFRINKILKGNYSDNSNILPYLARIIFDRGKVEEAEDLLKSNLESCEVIFGINSREAAFSHAHLMNFYIETRFFAKALEHAQQQNKLLVHLLSSKHEYSISSYEELGSVYYQMEMYENAINCFGDALSLSKKYFKDNFKFQQQLRYNQGLCFFNLGDYRKARFIFMRCLRFERNGLLLNLIGLSLSQTKPALSIKYHLMALEEYKCEMAVSQLKEIEILNSVDNNSFRQVKKFYLSKLKIKKLPNWLQEAYDL
jgi:tetratricopeptide (TPR) repeat protein